MALTGRVPGELVGNLLAGDHLLELSPLACLGRAGLVVPPTSFVATSTAGAVVAAGVSVLGSSAGWVHDGFSLPPDPSGGICSVHAATSGSCAASRGTPECDDGLRPMKKAPVPVGGVTEAKAKRSAGRQRFHPLSPHLHIIVTTANITAGQYDPRRSTRDAPRNSKSRFRVEGSRRSWAMRRRACSARSA